VVYVEFNTATRKLGLTPSGLQNLTYRELAHFHKLANANKINNCYRIQFMSVMQVFLDLVRKNTVLKEGQFSLLSVSL